MQCLLQFFFLVVSNTFTDSGGGFNHLNKNRKNRKDTYETKEKQEKSKEEIEIQSYKLYDHFILCLNTF